MEQRRGAVSFAFTGEARRGGADRLNRSSSDFGKAPPVPLARTKNADLFPGRFAGSQLRANATVRRSRGGSIDRIRPCNATARGGTVRGRSSSGGFGKAEPGESSPHVTAIMGAPAPPLRALYRARRSSLPVRPCTVRAPWVSSWRLGGSLAVAAPALRLTPSRALAVAFCGKWRGGKAPREMAKPQCHAAMIGSFLVLASGSRLNTGV
jgi:hypothetical protein